MPNTDTSGGEPIALVPPGARVRLASVKWRLEDGRQIGLTVGGSAVPLVFFHGIGMTRHTYIRVLNRLPQLGFLVIAIDAPGHGDTYAIPRHQDTFDARMETTIEVIEGLGIRRALLMGHSMGGRTVAEIAARRPDLALAAVMIDPAVGAMFDASRARIRSPRDTGMGLVEAMRDTLSDRVGLRRLGLLKHLSMLGAISVGHVLRPQLLMSAATAIGTAADSAEILKALPRNNIPAAVIHGERDIVVPLESAENAAELSQAAMVTLPGAYHSWPLTSPWSVPQILRHLIVERRVGEELAGLRPQLRNGHVDQYTLAAYFHDKAAVHDLAPPVEVIGRAEPRHNRHFHDYRIWPNKSL